MIIDLIAVCQVGKLTSPVLANLVKKQGFADVIDYIKTLAPTDKLQILAPLNDITPQRLESLMQDGILQRHNG